IDPARLAASNATWLGLQRDMPPLYSAMDVVALPSYREGFPRSLVEASAMGRPIVTTEIRGCREVVSDGVTGLLVPVAQTAPLRTAFESLLPDVARCARIGRAGRARAVARFDERAVFERIELAYRELALGPGRGATHTRPQARQVTT
ncbi:MAG: glycosyltransferase, partial [Deltaproteobacteria bacterium]